MDLLFLEVISNIIAENNINRLNPEEVKLIKKIGNGSQSLVYLAEYLGSYVVKKQLIHFDMKCIIHELAILSIIKHRRIPKFLGVILDESKSELSYVMSIITGKTLEEIDFNDLSYGLKIKIVKEISDIITFIHANNCVHRDIKAENFMVDLNFNVYIIDFGFSKVLNDYNEIITRAKGSINFASPDVFEVNSLTENGQIVSLVTPAVDVWGFACLISYIFSGIMPWKNKMKRDLDIQKALVKKKEFPIPDNIKDIRIIEIIKLGTCINSKQRKKMSEINDLIQNL